MFCVAQKTHQPFVSALFSKVFGDPEAFANAVFEQFAGPENVFIDLTGEGQLTAALFTVPVKLRGRSGVYFYGLCTEPAFRGQGIMTGLIEFAKEQQRQRGAQFAVLVPASEGLFDFYRQRGFEAAFGRRILQRPIRNNLWAQADMDSVTAKGLESLRQKYMPGGVLLNPAGYITVLTDLYSSGATAVSTDEGYGFFFKKGRLLEFVELFAQTDRAAELLLEAARQKTGADTARIFLGAEQNLFLGEGVRKSYGMICFLTQTFGIEDAHMGLMLDNE